jgi:lipopolysaccharide export LptBFGC system permease protein LptF
MKATGTSLYRIVAPVLLVATLLSAALFASTSPTSPPPTAARKPSSPSSRANPRRPSFAPTASGCPARPPAPRLAKPNPRASSTTSSSTPTATNVFANLTVFEFQPGTFNLTAASSPSARWDDKSTLGLRNGWQRTFSGESTATYQPFTVSTFPEIHEQPSYFKKEDRQSEEMSYKELSPTSATSSRAALTPRAPRPAQSQARLPAHDAGHGHPRHPVRALRRQARRTRGHRHRHRRSHHLLGRRRSSKTSATSTPCPAILAAWSPDILFAIAGSYSCSEPPPKPRSPSRNSAPFANSASKPLPLLVFPLYAPVIPQSS